MEAKTGKKILIVLELEVTCVIKTIMMTEMETTKGIGMEFKKPSLVAIQAAKPEDLIPSAMAKPPPRMNKTDQANLELADLNSKMGLGKGSLGSKDGLSTGRMNNKGRV